MSYVIVIRECNSEDLVQVNEVVRNAYLSNVTTSFIDAIFREITFQAIVSCAAVMYIFVGIPLPVCITAVPLVLLFIYVSIYASLLVKSMEVMQTKRPLRRWVAEAYEPYFSQRNPQSVCYRIVTEERAATDEVELNNLQRKIIGTVSVQNCRRLDESAWLYSLAVDKRYRRKGVGNMLVESAKDWCREKGFESVYLAKPECLEYTTSFFACTGFQMKRRYQKQVVGSLITYFMYYMECVL